MLVLSRKVGETIVVDDAIIITVVSVRRRCVQLGIHAPDSVGIKRGELLGRPLPGSGTNTQPRRKRRGS